MSAIEGARKISDSQETFEAESPASESSDDIGRFLGALATVLRETIVQFEDTVGRITDIVTMQSDRLDSDFMMALQNFDRLQQEFASLSDVLARVASTSGGAWWGDHAAAHEPGREAIAAIPIGDLKGRLLHHLGASTLKLEESPAEDEVVF